MLSDVADQKLGTWTKSQEVLDAISGAEHQIDKVMSLVSAAGLVPIELGTLGTFEYNVLAVIDGLDIWHDDCSLTACLNPLHPGPCKGWKHTLHAVSPEAWHALESARVEKANKRRLAQIEKLKAEGKPIPKKLLTPIEPKPAPVGMDKAGQTAKTATGEAHAAGQAVSKAAGVTPGKVTLGQAVKSLPSKVLEKGPKGKKPTLASKGIAFIIAQEKVTPQYKLDKAASITPEQWSALSLDDQKTILAELTHIKKEGFGPQQKKAAELADKLVSVSVKDSLAKQQVIIAPTQAKLNQAALDQAKADLLKAQHQQAPKPPVSMDVLDQHDKLTKAEFDTLPAAQKATITSNLDKAIGAKGTEEAGYAKAIKAKFAGTAPTGPKLGDVAATKVAYESTMGVHKVKEFHGYDPVQNAAVNVALGHGNTSVSIELARVDTLTKGQHASLSPEHQKLISDYLDAKAHHATSKFDRAKAKEIKAKIDGWKGPDTSKPPVAGNMVEAVTPDGKTVVGQMVTGDSIKSPSGGIWDIKPGTAVHAGPDDKPGVKKSAPTVLVPQEAVDKLADALHKAGEAKLTEKGVPLAPAKPKALPKHVQHAVDMSQGKAPGASWAKHQLTAYQPVTAEEFHGLPQATQDKIVSDLQKGHGKFLDPKKVAATEALLAKFGKPMGGGKVAHLTDTKIENPGLASHFNDHAVTKQQAKDLIHQAKPAEVASLAADLLNIKKQDLPDDKSHTLFAKAKADEIIQLSTAGVPAKVLGHPDVAKALQEYRAALEAQHLVLAVGNAKKNAFNAVDTKLALDKGDLSPIQREVLNAFKGQIVGHPLDTGAATKDSMMTNVNLKGIALQAVIKNVNKSISPSAALTNAEIKSRAEELMGAEAVKPNLNITPSDMEEAHDLALDSALQAAKGVDALTLQQPAVAGKYKDMVQAYEQLHAAEKASQKLENHVGKVHEYHLNFGVDKDGKPLSAADQKVIQAHSNLLYEENKHLNQNATKAAEKATTAVQQFQAAVKKAAESKPAVEGVTDYDKKVISQGYTSAWHKNATAAVTYGLKYDYTAKAAIKNHELYPAFLDQYNQLSKLAGEVAVARAEEHKANLEIPTNLDTGAFLSGPELDHWIKAKEQADQLQTDFNVIHKSAQAKLDKIRTDAGQKKRALPKLDSPAVKTAAAEHGYYTSGSYSGPNYNSPAKAKQYMLAKVGPKLGVAHLTASEKKAAKSAAPSVTPSKIENVAPAKPAEPVKLGDSGATITGVPVALKKQITSDFKGMPKGKYLADPTEDIFDNLVNLAAAHGPGAGGLSVDQVLKVIDETHAKNLGVANSGMLHAKVTDWLGTAAGKAYAETHSTPDAKVVKQLTGQLDLPEGVTLGPGEKVQKLAGPGAHDTALPASAFKAVTTYEMQKSQDQYMKAQGLKWSPSVKQSITSYTGSAYQTYNNYLRGDVPGNPQTKQAVVNIQSAMMPLQEHILLKRGTGWDALPKGFRSSHEAKALIGKTFQDHGFVSTTVAGESGHFSGQPLQLEIEAPAGTPAAFINSISHFKGHENELLLAAGTKFKVISVTDKHGHTLMRVRIVGDK